MLHIGFLEEENQVELEDHEKSTKGKEEAIYGFG
jgi:hypothetical protein